MKKPKQYEVISAEGSEIYEGTGTASNRYFGALVKDLPSGVIVQGLDATQSFRLTQGGKKIKALRVRYLDQFDGWVRADTLQIKD